MTSSLHSSCQWYRKYLKNNITNYWPLIQSALNGVDEYSARPSPKEFEIVIKFVLEIARYLVTERELALTDIVDPLVNAEFFKPELDKDEDRIIPNQLVFAVMGWLRKSCNLRICRREG
jgi:hypothetical protein